MIEADGARSTLTSGNTKRLSARIKSRESRRAFAAAACLQTTGCGRDGLTERPQAAEARAVCLRCLCAVSSACWLSAVSTRCWRSTERAVGVPARPRLRLRLRHSSSVTQSSCRSCCRSRSSSLTPQQHRHSTTSTLTALTATIAAPRSAAATAVSELRSPPRPQSHAVTG